MSIASSSNHRRLFKGGVDDVLLDGGEVMGGRFMLFIEVVGFLLEIMNIRTKPVYCHT